MSVMHSRIVAHGGQGQNAPSHPFGTSMTPMVMPLAAVTYYAGTGYYESLYPSQPATADPNHVPLASVAPGTFGRVAPAGRP